MRFRRRRHDEEAELNITSFMNLMIVLVPVLLLSMVFSRITVLELNLPDSASGSASEESEDLDFLEVVIYPEYLGVNHPAGNRAFSVCPLTEGEQAGTHNFGELTTALQQIKIRLEDTYDIEKNDIVLLAQPDTDYQTIVSTMDAVRSFKAVVAASVVDASLFPEISLGDAPENDPEATEVPCGDAQLAPTDAQTDLGGGAP
ncbi:biopolymer transporter ExbD [Gilvimarinus sp. SDUM040013]|uniref:Biopolymer transporter ExbD n=1 Tax=Gilvimarinus gilvus TaxID=3058038 RepID=A0ABU4S4H9_9GAMM|nr:biopolymer transporter ExbD [Gilvimarinus sp. SDUM040013]MDO3384623.1 biopolymer transporter ExbD [Gilvimarinus sp. SDUM040013]MDX6850209.1 biopolymer transporter ExbD [Gilvimarinus sp. SDUM040013]